MNNHGSIISYTQREAKGCSQIKKQHYTQAAQLQVVLVIQTIAWLTLELRQRTSKISMKDTRKKFFLRDKDSPIFFFFFSFLIFFNFLYFIRTAGVFICECKSCFCAAPFPETWMLFIQLVVSEPWGSSGDSHRPLQSGYCREQWLYNRVNPHLQPLSRRLTQWVDWAKHFSRF